MPKQQKEASATRFKAKHSVLKRHILSYSNYSCKEQSDMSAILTKVKAGRSS